MGTQFHTLALDGETHQELQHLGMVERQEANHTDNESHRARLLKRMEDMKFYLSLSLFLLTLLLWKMLS